MLSLCNKYADVCNAVLFGGLLITASAVNASAVKGAYEGIVTEDSGLGLSGLSMRVDFIYDSSVSPDSVFAGQRKAKYSAFLNDMKVTVGPYSWAWDQGLGSSYIEMINDGVFLFEPIQDRLFFNAYVFNGPDLYGSGKATDYSLEMALYDALPIGTPDGLSDYGMLPSIAPDPTKFDPPSLPNRIYFSFYADGFIYLIATSNVALASPVPEPANYGLLLAGLALLGIRVRRLSLRWV